ncbi:P-loop containing nucleoside triphosphate hydrolase protein [Fimicolochytrium jonesii]|uniref:P-loop containing nucleoside triphosphate hydrolase protein n=1 Tax=Fimicolochytrium jonesii TaxID=1396493 RepID=UPI0022FE97E8|nr:P-loop containing nucleoside triphosphate hydrolase protein [Fimicolochytrium jonesii]KAI8823977.1 P-loop containing nucleoside triphosphate hydrolase protein [Fimicolochytrium jonesii]
MSAASTYETIEMPEKHNTVPTVTAGNVDAEVEKVAISPTATNKAEKRGLFSKLFSKSKSQKEKPKEEPKPKIGYFELYKYATFQDKLLVFFGVLGAVGHGLGMPLMTIIFSDITGAYFRFDPSMPATVDHLDDQSRRGAVYFVILAVALFICAYAQMTFFLIAGENQARRIRELYFKALLRQDVGWFDATNTGELTTRITSDTALIQEGLSDKVGLIIQFCVTFLSGFVIAYFKSWRLALVLTACLPLIMGAAGLMARALNESSASGNTAYAAAGGVAQQVLSGIRTVVSFGGEKRAVERYDMLLVKAEKEAIKKSVSSAGGIALVQLIVFCVYSMAFWYGARGIKQGLLTGEEVLNCFFALIIGAFSLGQAVPFFGALASAQGAAYHVFGTIERNSPIDASSPNGERPDHVDGDIVFKGVSFHYPSRPDVPILKDFSLNIKAGTTVALVGASGSGKSTIVKLVERFYNPIAGSVTLDGRDISSLNVGWLRRQIGIVSQEPTLFDTSIRSNILYGLSVDPAKFSEAELDQMVEKACRAANAWGFIQNLPQGVHTSVGEAGGMLSGGQKQRIAIARVVIRDPRILLLDEATSALDTESERLVQAALETAATGRTTIVIAHRLSTIKNADMIVVMSRGVIVETGTHDELYAKDGVYRGLVDAQRLRGRSADSPSASAEDLPALGEVEEIPAVAEEPRKSLGDAPATIDIVEVDPTGAPAKPTRKESLAAVARRNSSIKRQNSLVRKTKEEQEEEEEKRKADLLKRKVDLWRILRFNRPEFWYMWIGIVAACGTGAVMPVFSVIFTNILRVFGIQDLDEMERQANRYALYFLLLAIAAFVAYFLQFGLLRIAGDKLTTRLRMMSFQSLVKQEIGFFDEEDNNTGALTAKLAEDATLVQGLTGATFAQIVGLISNFAVGLTIAFASSWQITLVVLACVPIIAGGGYLQLRSLTGFGQKSRKAYISANQTANEAIECVRTVQTLTQEQAFVDKYAKLVEVPHKMVINGAFVSAVGFASAESTVFLTYALAFFYGARLILWGTYSASTVLRAMFAIIFSAMAAGQLSNFAPDASKAKLAAIAVLDILDRHSKIDATLTSGQRPSDTRGLPSTTDAHFVYPTRPDTKVLRGLNVRADVGKTVALVGHSGCGKSTVLGLLERWYDVASGHADLDGLDVREWNTTYLREQMALVGQEPVLFDLSIRENIAYGAIGGVATSEEIEAAARQANIHDFVASLPQGYDTLVGEKGGQLSGGQKQRIAIARALIRHPKLLLLDEATSALDSESEKVVQEALDAAAKGRTTVVIAHRLSTIQNADCIYVVKNGRVAESGTHEELVQRQGLYADLVSQQMLHKME